MRRPARYLNLRRPKLRLSWNKHNLYNIAKGVGSVDMSRATMRTFFQQKWEAKSSTRGYHGEHIPEKKWKRMFTRQLASVVEMNPRYLAEHDGSEQATGRGSGMGARQVAANDYATWFSRGYQQDEVGHYAAIRVASKVNKEMELEHRDITPLMQMTYAPVERRLDMAVFRSLFATSIRQARLMVVHGAVTVNGKKMVYPAYRLNPGDMFQVDVGKVLAAVSKHKNPETKLETAKVVKMLKNNQKLYDSMEKRLRVWNDQFEETVNPKTTEVNEDGEEKPAFDEAQVIKKFRYAIYSQGKGKDGAAAAEAQTETPAEGGEEAAAEGAEGGESAAKPSAERLLSNEEGQELKRLKLETALIDAKLLIRDQSEKTDPLWRELKLRSFRDQVGRALDMDTSAQTSAKELISQLETNMKSLSMLHDEKSQSSQAAKAPGQKTPRQYAQKALWLSGHTSDSDVAVTVGLDRLSVKEFKDLARLLRSDAENPIDEHKPYPTPWAPRPFMKPFVFVPRYLEVNHTTCSAVYLRHPVARKGMGEVPTPFNFFTNQLAHNWYVGRGSKHATM